MSLIKHKLPKEFGFSAYWENPEDEKKVGKIKTSMLVLQGELDYVVGIKQANIIYNSLTSVTKENKKLSDKVLFCIL